MIRSLLLQFGLAITLLAGMASAGAQEKPDVQTLSDLWIQAYNMADRAQLSELYSEDAYLMMHGGDSIKGRQAIGDFWAKDFLENNPITTLQVTHSVQGVDMILVHGNYQVLNRNDGILLGQGRFAHIWMLGSDGEWRLDRDLWQEPFDPY